jgi:predicted O-methyltransferase YrrM
MTLAAILQKAARLPNVARDGWRYPVLRLQAQRQQTAVEALAALGFEEEALWRYEQDFEELAPALYAELADRARAGGDELAASRAAAPSESSTEGKKLLYVATRATRPRTVVETGPYNGASSAFLLRALEDNGDGRLHSFDLPEARDALGHPAGREPGWLVPAELRHRFEVTLGDTRETLKPALRRLEEIDLFFHDSLHTARHMLFEFRAAWPHLRAGGLLVSDDVFWNPAFWAFTRSRRAPFRHTGTLGVTRKRR